MSFPTNPFGSNLVAFRMLLGPGAITPNYTGASAFSSDVGLLSPTSNAFQTAQRFNVGYYNSGFLSGLGGTLKSLGPYIAAAGSIAAEVLPAIYHTGTSGATQSPAAGPTGAPAMTKPAMKGTSLVQKIEQVADPAFLGGPKIGKGKTKTVKVHPSGAVTIHHHRRMNPCNIHALRRSLRRANAFTRIAKRVLHVTMPKHHVSAFKQHRKKRT